MTEPASALWRNAPLLLTALLVIALDQISKWLIVTNLAPGQAVPAEGLFRLTYVVNPGSAFGLFQDRSAFFVVIAIAAIGLITFYYRYLGGGGIWVTLALGLMLGGAIGNLIDRLRYGHVVDFIHFRYFWVFNLADSAISVGVCLLAVLLLFGSSSRRRVSDPQ